MKGYVFRVTPENDENVYREILVPEKATFEDLHFTILDAFRIERGEMASFYVSDENWNKKEEITLMEMGMNEKGTAQPLLMGEVKIGDKISDDENFFFYTYDFLFCKNFEIELIDEEEVSGTELSIVKSEGRYQEDVSAYDDFYLDDLDTDDVEPIKKKGKKSDDFDDFDDFDQEEDNFDDDDDYNEKNYDNFDDYDL